MSDVPNEDILSVLFKNMDAEERAVLCSVQGDPSTVDGWAWAGIPWAKGARCPLMSNRNNYVAISSFKPHAEDKKFRRRKDQFGAVHAIMVDDVGTKVHQQRVPLTVVPTMVVETSPGNYQFTYALETPMHDQEAAEHAIRQMIMRLSPAGTDPGMSGVTRVLRLPGGVNAKQKYMAEDGQPWQCRLRHWEPHRRTSWTALCAAYGVVGDIHRHYIEPTDDVTIERKRSFELVVQGLQILGRIKRGGNGWFDIRCPWIKEHTDRADTGAAVATPARANGYMGGYRCHHGHCSNRNWGDLEEWVAEAIVEEGRRTRRPFRGVQP